MKKTISIIIVNIYIMVSITIGGQDGPEKDMSQNYLDSLCLTMSDECRAVQVSHIDVNNDDRNEIVNHWFTKYLYLKYDTTGTPCINVTEKRLKEGTMRRVAEG
jgi:hypothetical protein